jgi:hypothetical protein
MAEAVILSVDGSWVSLGDWKHYVQLIETSVGLVPLTSLAFERRVYSLLGKYDRIATIASDLLSNSG